MTNENAQQSKQAIGAAIGHIGAALRSPYLKNPHLIEHVESDDGVKSIKIGVKSNLPGGHYETARVGWNVYLGSVHVTHINEERVSDDYGRRADVLREVLEDNPAKEKNLTDTIRAALDEAGYTRTMPPVSKNPEGAFWPAR